MIENYDNIVFDLGGVIFNIDVINASPYWRTSDWPGPHGCSTCTASLATSWLLRRAG